MIAVTDPEMTRSSQSNPILTGTRRAPKRAATRFGARCGKLPGVNQAHPRRYWLSALALSASLAATVHAQTVGDDASLRQALHAAKPGDVIKIKAGTYRGGIYATVVGTKDKPVTIEAEDPKTPPLIEGGEGGLQIAGAQHVTLRNLRFHGATGSGLNIDDGGKLDRGATGIVIENVQVTDVGPRGNQDGIKLSGVREFSVKNCTIEGWGGSAIDMVGCHDGVIEGCTFRGKKGFESSTGPQCKGGSANVTIRNCRFDNAGDRAINCGGSTGVAFFRPQDAKFEAKDITIEGNVFRGGSTPVAFVGVDGAIFRQNTIIDPNRFLLRILQESTDARFVPCRNVTVEKNLFLYKRARLAEAINVGAKTDAASFKFKDNWWFCSDAPQFQPQLPSKEFGGTHGRDPKLKYDEDGWPTAKPGAPIGQ
jgi:hypothetical protein